MKVIICSKAGNCQEVENIAKQIELMIVIGNKKSLNSNNLYELAEQASRNAMFVETIDDLYINYIKRFKIVGVVYDSVVSQDMVDKIIEIVKNLKTEGYMYENSR